MDVFDFRHIFDWLSWSGQPWWLLLISLALAALSAGHALLHKRHSASALAWMVVCLTLPLMGALVYRLLGVNRVRRRARQLRTPWQAPASPATWPGRVPIHLERLAELGRRITGSPLSGGNGVQPLVGGEQAYPRMLQAIDQGQQHVALATYIFETNQTGRQFVDTMAAAQQRGCRVDLLVDGIGERYSRPPIGKLLDKRGDYSDGRAKFSWARFLPPRLLPPTFYLNLRNHRKLLCVDDQVAFTGGMNIGDRHLLSSDNPTRDVHFELRGPVVQQLTDCFDADWQFAGGAALPKFEQPSADPQAEQCLCRVVLDGPDDDIGNLQSILLAAIASARHRIIIVTPYFLPDTELCSALTSAALAGLRVDVVLPARSNLRYVDWASRSLWAPLLQHGVRMHLQPAPFDHSKLFVIDEDYSLITTANIDSRSLRLNFELAVEVYSTSLAIELKQHVDDLIEAAQPVSMHLLTQRSLLTRLRDRCAWLMTPYL